MFVKVLLITLHFILLFFSLKSIPFTWFVWGISGSILVKIVQISLNLKVCLYFYAAIIGNFHLLYELARLVKILDLFVYGLSACWGILILISSSLYNRFYAPIRLCTGSKACLHGIGIFSFCQDRLGKMLRSLSHCHAVPLLTWPEHQKNWELVVFTCQLSFVCSL